MSWVTGSALTDEHRARLLAVGVDPDRLATIHLREAVGGPLPAWWSDCGNALYLADGVEPPSDELMARMLGLPFSGALLVLASSTEHMLSLLLGDVATVFLGPDSQLMAGEIFCGGNSSIVLQGAANGTRAAMLDARNGGSIVAGYDQLWAANTYIATDDMHRLEDAETGARLNPFGAQIRLGSHVWLCRGAIVTGHAEVGDGAVVGQNSLVRGQKVPPNTAVAGVPARVIREGVTWRADDLP